MKSNKPAFPYDYELLGSQEPYHHAMGMQLRDYFAAQCMPGDWVPGPDGDGWSAETPNENLERRARLYYRMADAMMKVRDE